MRKTIIALAIAGTALMSTVPAFAGPAPKVSICHIPPGNPENAHVIEVNQNSVQAHVDHGDVRPNQRPCAE